MRSLRRYILLIYPALSNQHDACHFLPDLALQLAGPFSWSTTRRSLRGHASCGASTTKFMNSSWRRCPPGKSLLPGSSVRRLSWLPRMGSTGGAAASALKSAGPYRLDRGRRRLRSMVGIAGCQTPRSSAPPLGTAGLRDGRRNRSGTNPVRVRIARYGRRFGASNPLADRAHGLRLRPLAIALIDRCGFGTVNHDASSVSSEIANGRSAIADRPAMVG